MTSKPLNEMSVVEIARGVRCGAFPAEEVVRSCLARVREREPEIAAWTFVNQAGALAQAQKSALRGGALAGVPFGVKDVIDTADAPTEMGSRAYQGHRPRFDAGCVGTVLQAGAILLGKTVTAEFAGTQPTRTSNPRNLAHTPGGSSSGSAAAVADFMVPFAFGTQTGGSVLRPAAFCGIVGFKPSYGAYTTAGVKTAAHSFDTVGLLARSVADVALVHAVIMNTERDDAPDLDAAPRIGVFRSHLWNIVEPFSAAALERTAEQLGQAGAVVCEVPTPAGFETITEQRAIINAFERARGLAGEWPFCRDVFSPQTRDVCERGFAISGERYFQACRAVHAFRQVSAELLDRVDVLLAPATPGEAPQGKDYAGDPRLQELWTMLHMPSMTLPASVGESGLPIGIQLIGNLYEDARLLACAKWIEQRLALLRAVS
jgi:Asp-tRNA(Asn)/Glu-tRNA(Gln) amidotransferase A subunit family amidase